MSAGVPVVASRVGGLLEVVRHCETGMLVENDAAQIAAAMHSLLDDPALASRLGEAARRDALTRFTVEQMVSGTLNVYRQVLS